MTKWLIQALFIVILMNILPPYVDGVRYSMCGVRDYEQQWLDNAIEDLKRTRTRCFEPDLQQVLDYAIARYNKLGAWDVAIMPCPSLEGIEYIGLNDPICPGITLDPIIMTWPLHQGALVIVHESLHDYFPYIGHDHVYPIMARIEAL